MENIRRGALRLIMALFVASLSCAAVAATPPVVVKDARIRLLPPDLPLAGYFTMLNQGKQTVRLTGASSPAFAHVHLHKSMTHNGQSGMMAIDGVSVEPGSSVRFAPGGFHLMMMQRRRDLAVGDHVPVTLTFADGSALKIDFSVEGATAR